MRGFLLISVVWLAGLGACAPTSALEQCRSSCTGCCDQWGNCNPWGGSQNACGGRGTVCQVCAGVEACVGGLCRAGVLQVGGSGGSGGGQGGSAGSGAMAFCTPVSSSGAMDRGAARASAVETATYFGTVSIIRDAAGRPTSIRVDGPGSLDDYADTLIWDAAGHLTYFRHDASGAALDFTESYTWNSQGHLTYYRYDAEGSDDDLTESLTWDSKGRLIYFRHDAADSQSDYTESFTYDANGRLTYWRRDGATDADDATLSVTYDSAGNISSSSFHGGSPLWKGVVRWCR